VKTTRDNLTQAKKGILILLNLIHGLPDEEIDKFLDADEAAGINKVVWNMVNDEGLIEA
jgi:hypothetical protein